MTMMDEGCAENRLHWLHWLVYGHDIVYIDIAMSPSLIEQRTPHSVANGILPFNVPVDIPSISTPRSTPQVSTLASTLASGVPLFKLLAAMTYGSDLDSCVYGTGESKSVSAGAVDVGY